MDKIERLYYRKNLLIEWINEYHLKAATQPLTKTERVERDILTLRLAETLLEIAEETE